MSRKASLTNEQVFVVRNDVFKKSLKEYIALLKVSAPTIIAAKKARPPYNEPFTKEFEDAMVAKYFN